jgi:hypothetical protein
LRLVLVLLQVLLLQELQMDQDLYMRLEQVPQLFCTY